MASKEIEKALLGYESHIEKFGYDRDVMEAYYQAVFWAKESDDDLKTALRIAPRAKEVMNQYVLESAEGDLWALEKFCFDNKVEYEILDQYYSILKLEAQNKNLDSYLLYLEKNRIPRERFYAPKKQQFAKFGLIDAYQGAINDLYDIVCISMPPGTGKAQPLYSKILTPNGFITMGEVKVGTKVISGTGNICNVIGVYPQGTKPIYEVVFDDGSKCRCSDEHLWKVQTRDDRNKKRHGENGNYRVVPLSEMMGKVYVESGKRKNYSIDYIPKIDCQKEKDLLIHPYVMGVLLGDGSLSSGNLNVSTEDNEILENLKKFLPKDYSFTYKGGCDYRIITNSKHIKGKSEFTKYLEKYELVGKTSKDKFIPKEYLCGNYQQRLELLRGLMDTDGSATKNYCEYCTISERLAENVTELVHSLGGYCSKTKKKAGYRKNGKYVKCNDCFILIIEFPNGMDDIFRLTRKSKIYTPKRNAIKRFITDIKYIGEEECQCIMIDDESHLYITDDYIITHNTTLLKFFNSAVIGWFPKDYNLFYSHSGDITRMYYDGVIQMVTDDQEYTWKEIFPDLQVTSTNAKMQQFNIGSYKPFPSLQTASVGSENAGKVRASKFLFIDDMIGKLEEALNKNILEKLWGAYTVDARQRKTMDFDGRPCKEIVNATRWSTLDPLGRIIKMYQGNPRVKVIAMPDIDPVTNESNFDYEFGGFTVAFFNDQALLMDDVSYKCLFKQQPIEREGLVFPEEKVQRYLNLPKEKPDEILGQCDTKGKGTDYFVLPCLYRYGDDFYCVDCVCDNTADYELQYENSANLIVHHEMNNCEFESNAGGDRVAMEVNNRVEKKGWICNITTRATESNKEARIFQCSSWILQHIKFKDKSLYTPKEQYGVMMSLLLGYSVSAAKQLDDVPDVFSNFALRMTRKTKTARAEAIQNPFRRGGYGYL